jgi:hypothetical protein
MMKISLFAGLVLTTVLAAAPVFAQSPTKAPETAPEVTVLPANQVSAFFGKLVEGRVDAAYDELLKGTKIDDNPKDVATLKTKTRDAIKAFGALEGYEVVKVTNVGKGEHLVCLTCLSLGKSFPIRWRFYFYNPTYKGGTPRTYEQMKAGSSPDFVSGVWKLIDIRIDDRLMDMFDEPAPAAAPDSAK